MPSTKYRVGNAVVVGRDFLNGQAAILLKFARIVSDPKISAALIEKAADIKDRVDGTIEPPDKSPKPPDVEPAAS
jgi:hypothetical protein